MRVALKQLLIFTFGWTAVLSSGGYKDMSLLLENIFKNYSAAACPCADAQSPVHVDLSLRICSILDLNIKEQMLKIRGFFKFMWTDERLSWDPKDYGNISFTYALQDKVWRPDVILTSLQGDSYVGSPETLAILFSNGKVVWEPSFTASFSCEVHIPKFPLDDSECQVVVAPWANHNSSIVLQLREPHIALEKTVSNGQFDVSVGDAYKAVFPYESWFYEEVFFSIKLIRKPAYAFMSLLFPLFVLGLLGPVAFLIPPDDAEKVGVSVTVLLATVVFTGLVHDNLPNKSDQISTVAIYVSSLLLLSFLGVLGNTIVLAVHRKKDGQVHTSDSPPSWKTENLARDICLSSNIPKDSVTQPDPKWITEQTKKCLEAGPEKVSKLNPKLSSKPKSRAQQLNLIFFISNTAAVIFITLAVFAFIFY
ncbi:hypothetical protein RRG08_024668 [Elysia crispata]|uniref:Uncharacterized protein n=1 Tax=Elysia crispata TaxID=231223 RepID=A0AAE1DNJ2_9GAST|nr:hypothetical protein RRG08_024668 [Elysia crispata]